MKNYQKKILIKMGLKDTKKVLESLRGKDLDKYHYFRLKMFGNKDKDYFEITEFRGSEKNIFNYDNLTEWDLEEYEYQKAHKTEVRKEYDSLYIQPMHFMALTKSFSFEKKRSINYGMLQSLRWYIIERVLENLIEIADNKYPSILERKDLFDFTSMPKRKAAGKEEELDILTKKIYENYHKMDDYIVNNIKDLSGYTFYMEGGEFMEGLNNYLIGGFEASDNINFNSFFNDFYELEESGKIVEQRIKEITKKFKKEIID